MLEIAIWALIIALVAGALGFTGIARGAATVAKVFFVLFLVIAAIFFLLVLAGVGAAI